MKILTRHLLAELLKVFFVALVSLTLMMILIGIVKQAMQNGLGPEQMVRLLPYILPDALRFSLPATALFAATSVYGRMSGDNEIVAAKSLGINPMSLLWPVLTLSFVLSLATCWLNDLAVSWGRNGIQRVAIEAVDKIAYGMLRTQRSYSTKEFSISVGGVDGRKLVEPILTFSAAPGRPAFMVTAREAELRRDPEKNVLIVVCRDFRIIGEGQNNLQSTGTEEFAIPLDVASNVNDTSGKPSQLALRWIPAASEEARTKIEEEEKTQALKAAYHMLTGELPGLYGEEWSVHELTLRQKREQLYRLRTEPPRRMSAGFSCLCFVLVGAPLAIRRRSASILTSFFLCFLPILIVYYPLLALGVGSAKEGVLPPESVWAGNILLAIWGWWLIRRVVRY